MEEEYLSAAQAAAIVGLAYPTIIKHINAGNLQAQRMGSHFAITKSDLINFKIKYYGGEFNQAPRIKESARLEAIAREVSEAVAARQLVGAK